MKAKKVVKTKPEKNLVAYDEVRTIAVLAGSHEQFERFSHQYPTELIELIYIDRPEKARGYRFSDYVIVGTFWERSDASRLMREIEYNSGIIVNKSTEKEKGPREFDDEDFRPIRPLRRRKI